MSFVDSKSNRPGLRRLTTFMMSYGYIKINEVFKSLVGVVNNVHIVG